MFAREFCVKVPCATFFKCGLIVLYKLNVILSK